MHQILTPISQWLLGHCCLLIISKNYLKWSNSPPPPGADCFLFTVLLSADSCQSYENNHCSAKFFIQLKIQGHCWLAFPWLLETNGISDTSSAGYTPPHPPSMSYSHHLTQIFITQNLDHRDGLPANIITSSWCSTSPHHCHCPISPQELQCFLPRQSRFLDKLPSLPSVTNDENVSTFKDIDNLCVVGLAWSSPYSGDRHR